MEYIINAILFLLGFFFLSLIIKEKKKYKELKNLQDKEIEDRYKKEFERQIEKQKEGINLLEKEKEQIQREISEKQEFNNSLFKLRENELNRLIEEKRKEKESALEKQIESEKEKQISQMIEELKQFEEAQNKVRADYMIETEKIREEFNTFSDKRAAINEAILRERQLEEQENFYRIVVPPDDIEDIEVLNTIAPRLRNREALNKLIYSLFIQRPLEEMTKRVVSGKETGGIYKITYIKTGEAYIGKTTNFKKRWADHVKSALDIGTIAHSSFHTRLKNDGVWNYTFEILEEVPKDKLTEREKFYIQLYGTDTQLNMKVG